MMFTIQRYTADRADEWNQFVAASKNGTFLFYRGYMDYHHDRFEDCSLMVYRRNKLFALLPGNRKGDVFVSHQGLTYGGLLMNGHCTTALVRDLFGYLNTFLREHHFSRVVYKPVPWIYASLPSEEALYALCNVCHARLVSRDVASVVMLSHRLPYSTLRRRCIKKAARAQVDVRESDDWQTFWLLLEHRLMQRHGAHPVHTLSEILLLHSRFPAAIRLFAAYHQGRMVGGTVLFITPQTVKTQYIAADDEGLAVGALDGLFDHLISQFAEEGHTFFDFGTSNMPGSDELHDTLIFQKEGFGARAVCYDCYEYDL